MYRVSSQFNFISLHTLYAKYYLDVQPQPLPSAYQNVQWGDKFLAVGKTVGAELIGNLPMFHCVLLWFQLSEALIDPIFLNPKRDILLQLSSPTDIFPRSCSLKYLLSLYSFLLHILFLHSLSLSQLQGFVFQKSGGGREWGRESERGAGTRECQDLAFVIGWLLPDG